MRTVTVTLSPSAGGYAKVYVGETADFKKQSDGTLIVFGWGGDSQALFPSGFWLSVEMSDKSYEPKSEPPAVWTLTGRTTKTDHGGYVSHQLSFMKLGALGSVSRMEVSGSDLDPDLCEFGDFQLFWKRVKGDRNVGNLWKMDDGYQAPAEGS